MLNCDPRAAHFSYHCNCTSLSARLACLSVQCKVSQLVNMRCSRVTRCPKTPLLHSTNWWRIFTLPPYLRRYRSFLRGCPNHTRLAVYLFARQREVVTSTSITWVISCSFNLLLTQLTPRAIQSTLLTDPSVKETPRVGSCLSLLPLDKFRFQGNCPPTPPLTQHFALREK